MSIRVRLAPAWGLAICAAIIALPNAYAQDKKGPAALQKVSSASADVPNIPFSQFTLPNGLRVILNEDHSSPIVSVNLFYHVGSKNEVLGKTGIAHLLEHLADAGTEHVDSKLFQRVVIESGGQYNASTKEDWTRYFTTVTSNQLETILWLQADQMAGLRPSDDRYHSERSAVDNEYGFRVLNGIGGRIGEIVFSKLYEGTTYGTPLFGSHEDRQTETIDDILAFSRKYYVPNNALVVLSGDFASSDARRMVTKYFGRIPRGAPVEQAAQAAPFRGESRLVLENPTSPTKELWILWRGASSPSTDRVPLVALNSILRARLTRLLVTDRRIASNLDVPGLPGPSFAAFDLEKGGVFQTTAVVTGSLTETERLMDSAVTSIRTNGVTAAELRHFVAGFKTEFLMNMLSVQTKAYMLGDAALTQGDPAGSFKDIARADRLTPAEIQRVARKYLGADRVVLSMVPAGKLTEISKPDLPYISVPWVK